MGFSFHPEAFKELQESIDYYEQLEPGLGLDFAREVQLAIRRALAMPGAWTLLDAEVRRCLVRRFPYGVLYVEEGQDLLILAVMNLHRSPDYWQDRQAGE